MDPKLLDDGRRVKMEYIVRTLGVFEVVDENATTTVAILSR